ILRVEPDGSANSLPRQRICQRRTQVKQEWVAELILLRVVCPFSTAPLDAQWVLAESVALEVREYVLQRLLPQLARCSWRQLQFRAFPFEIARFLQLPCQFPQL